MFWMPRAATALFTSSSRGCDGRVLDDHRLAGAHHFADLGVAREVDAQVLEGRVVAGRDDGALRRARRRPPRGHAVDLHLFGEPAGDVVEQLVDVGGLGVARRSARAAPADRAGAAALPSAWRGARASGPGAAPARPRARRAPPPPAPPGRAACPAWPRRRGRPGGRR